MTSQVADDILGVFKESEQVFSEEEVDAAFEKMASAISQSLSDKDPLVVSVMMGGLIPAARLSSCFDFPHQLDYLHATRYQGYTQGGELSWIARPRLPIENRVLLVVDDILDQGVTLAAIVEDCLQQGAKDVRTAVLVKKRHERNLAKVKADFVGLEVEDRYVVGCGMDYKEYWRHLKGIHALKEPR